jgi:long-chain acyl-CoA synthetase
MRWAERASRRRSRHAETRPAEARRSPLAEDDGHVPDSVFVQALSNLAEFVRRNARTAGSAPALIGHGETLTWSELDARVDAYAQGLQDLSLPSTGDHPARVAIALPNSPEFAVTYLATLRAGLVAMPINPGYTGRELSELLAESRASVLIGTGDVTGAVGPVRAGLIDLTHSYRLGTVVDPRDGAEPIAALAHDGAGAVAEITGGEDLAVLLYTSGSLGRPKGAMLSHRALLANHAQLAAIDPPPIGPDDVALLAVPLFHAYGLNSGLGAVVFQGATGVLVEAFDPVESLRVVAAHRVSALIGVPTMFLAWSLLPGLADSLASVRVAVCGAAPLGADVAQRFAAAVRPIHVGYGLTETAPVLTTTLTSVAPKVGSIGRPIPGVQIALRSASGETVWDSAAGPEVDDFDDDAAGSPGTDPGEIVVRGANLFSGYWPDGAGGPDESGWYATGDVAYADADGDLFIVDRLRELILVNGFNVYPLEVEQVLASHPAVVEAAVIGLDHPYTGQTVKAFVVASAPVGVDELLAYCARNLARFKCPTAIEFADALPHSATGKVRKGPLRRAAGADV